MKSNDCGPDWKFLRGAILLWAGVMAGVIMFVLCLAGIAGLR